MQIKAITTQKDFYNLSTLWNTLLEKSGSNTIFSTFEWLSTWWEYYGHDKKLFILLALDSDEIIGIAPLTLEKSRILRYVPWRVVSFIGSGKISDYADFIIVRRREEVLKGFFEYLGEKRRLWDEIDLREIREDSPNLAVLRNDLDNWGVKVTIHELGKCPYIKLNGDWDGYFKSLSKNFRQDIRTQYNRMDKKGFTHSLLFKEEGIDDLFLSNLIDMHLKGTDRKNKVSFLASEIGRGFFNEIVQKFGMNGWLGLNTLNINDKVAAYILGFQYGKIYYDWNIGKGDKYDIFSPGKLLLHQILEGLFSNGRIDEFDFLRGEEDYKYRWAKVGRRNYRVSVWSSLISEPLTSRKLLCNTESKNW